ncbi:MAG TPA: FtsW/RodA/SpoVE family cell cycle protein [Candidatus Limnocylindria bacterium]|nr:FtsW/RodA/SpoVE family cell cycle protein [Candidatus Limnocylindria bacterium]
MFAIPQPERQPRVEWLQVLALFGLMLVGVAFIYSATLAHKTNSVPWYREQFFMQMVWYAAGITAAVVICFIEYHTLARWSMVGYWLAILLLVLVLVPGIGSTHGWGARRWIDFGPFSGQPSEFAKLAFIVAFANFLSRPIDELRLSRIFFRALGMIILPFALIMKEPDLGSALIFLPVGLVMMFVAGVPARFIRRLVFAVGLLIALFLVDVLYAPPQWQIKLQDYQKRRLLVYFGRDYASAHMTEAQRHAARVQQKNDSYNVEQALISVGTGGMFGKGWKRGTQNALGFLPRAVAHNDFIFSVIAEEKGFMGSVIVIALYSVVLFTGIRMAGQVRDRLGKILAVGVVTLIFSHVFINIGMNIRLMPVTGVPLPLLSYGGSSVLCSLIAIGILQNVNLYRRSY